MKIITVAGTRPELIRLSIIIKKLDELVDHVFIYTNQNYDYNLSGVFFDELNIRTPDYYFTNEGYSIGNFLSNAILQFEEVLLKEKPDKMLVLGDTNSGLLSIIAKKHSVHVYHMEAGNRCFSEDTEIFTDEGWKFFYELKGTERILTRFAGGRTEWSPILAQQKYYHSGKMYNLNQKGIDILVTPDHKFCLEPKKPYSDKCNRYKRGFFDYIFRTVDEFNGTKYYIPKTFKWNGDKEISKKYSDDFLKLFGWYITEGCCNKKHNGITIYQSKNSKEYEEIINDITKCGYNAKPQKRSIHFSDKKLHDYFIKFGLSYDKYIPHDIKQLPPEKLKILIDIMLKGDGTISEKEVKYYTTSDKLAYDFQEISYKAGYNCEMSKTKGRKCTLSKHKRISRDIWYIRISDKIGQGSNNRIATYKKYDKSKWIKEINYDGFVYDVTVNNHTIWVKRNNKCIWSSNCYDDRLPEETNRRIIDHVAKYNLPYTENSKQNLLSEGFHKNHVFKTGNPIYEVLNFYESEIENSSILNKLELKEKDFVLVTVHRTENVDNVESLLDIIESINIIAEKFKVVLSMHPRTKSKLKGFELSDKVIVSKPFGFFDFVKLEKNAKMVISDSGTVQEECCIFKVPSITIRNSTERQETIECGSNVLSGTRAGQIMRIFKTLLNREYTWTPPEDYTIDNVSDIVINILLGV